MNFRLELQSQRKHGKIKKATPGYGNLVNCVISPLFIAKRILSPDLIISLCYAKWSPTVVSLIQNRRSLIQSFVIFIFLRCLYQGDTSGNSFGGGKLRKLVILFTAADPPCSSRRAKSMHCA